MRNPERVKNRFTPVQPIEVSENRTEANLLLQGNNGTLYAKPWKKITVKIAMPRSRSRPGMWLLITASAHTRLGCISSDRVVEISMNGAAVLLRACMEVMIAKRADCNSQMKTEQVVPSPLGLMWHPQALNSLLHSVLDLAV